MQCPVRAHRRVLSRSNRLEKVDGAGSGDLSAHPSISQNRDLKPQLPIETRSRPDSRQHHRRTSRTHHRRVSTISRKRKRFSGRNRNANPNSPQPERSRTRSNRNPTQSHRRNRPNAKKGLLSALKNRGRCSALRTTLMQARFNLQSKRTGEQEHPAGGGALD